MTTSTTPYYIISKEEAAVNAAKRQAKIVKRNAKRNAEREREANKSPLQLCIETINCINSYTREVKEIGINIVNDIQCAADKAGQTFPFDVCTSILRYGRASEKQAFVIAKFYTSI